MNTSKEKRERAWHPKAAMPLKNTIPWVLLLARVVLGPIIFVLALRHAASALLIVLMLGALFSDIYDGVLARRWQVVTPKLRVADSRADVFYFAWIAATIALLHPALAHSFRWPFRIILLLYAMRWTQDLIKYRRLASYHSYVSRATGLVVFTACVAAIASFHAAPFLWVAFVFGVCNHLEAMATTFVLPHWVHDVGSVRQAVRLRERARSQDTAANC
jgi:CDP-diacylglycerol--glycerol-3-phosphate 3-phosphatidyltransferase